MKAFWLASLAWAVFGIRLQYVLEYATDWLADMPVFGIPLLQLECSSPVGTQKGR
jgi:hypothetical protein